MPDIIGLNKIFENKEQAIESFGELGERLISRSEDGKQVLARYYDEDGNVASLIGVYHYKRTGQYLDPYTQQERIVDYGNIEIRDGNINNDCQSQLDELISELEILESIVNSASTAINELAIQVDYCCPIDYLTFVNLQDNPIDLQLLNYGNNNPVMYYSLDDGATFEEWLDDSGYTPVGNETSGRHVTVPGGQSVKFYGENENGFSFSEQVYSRFTAIGEWECHGNVMTLLNQFPNEDIPNNYCFYSLFFEFGGLTTAPDLPATGLSEYCYFHMFDYCSHLKNAPELPAETMRTKCYSYMFRGCDSLVEMPQLRAMDLAEYCYEHMFDQCDGFVSLYDYELPATQAAPYCYYAMFKDCENLEKPLNILLKFLDESCCRETYMNCVKLAYTREIGAEEAYESCYESMYENCVKLSETGQIHLNRTAKRCCARMFYGCTNLSYANDLYPIELGDSCYMQMFSNCVILKRPATMKINRVSYSSCESMYYHCTNLSEIDNVYLLADTVYERSYASMFYECENFGSVREDYLPATHLALECYRSMFELCIRLGNGPKLPARVLAESCYYKMFKDTALKAAPDLNAETGVIGCYEMMFYNCTNMGRIYCKLRVPDSDDYTNAWMTNVHGSGFFYKHAEATWDTGVSGIPVGWTVYDY